MLRTTTYLTLGLTLAVSTGCGESDTIVPPPVDWVLTFSDEFEGEAGQAPDATKWTYDVGDGTAQGIPGWGNNELQFYTNTTNNASLDGEGSLAITAREEDFGGLRYTSARLKTQGLFSQRYGRIEARIQVPPGKGLLPAFWMLSETISEVDWPQSGEIDVMEFLADEPGESFGTVHGPGYSGGESISGRFALDEGERFADDFHVFAVDWDSSRIAFWVDDTVYKVLNTTEVGAKGDWVFNTDFFVLLNIAVGGNLPGSPDASTVFPQTMRVDYVRVFERNPASFPTPGES